MPGQESGEKRDHLWIFQALGMPQEAILCYQRALQSRPDYAMAFGKCFVKDLKLNHVYFSWSGWCVWLIYLYHVHCILICWSMTWFSISENNILGYVSYMHRPNIWLTRPPKWHFILWLTQWDFSNRRIYLPIRRNR